jgi:hypothetical protein
LQGLLCVAIVLIYQYFGQVLEEMEHILVDVPKVLENAAGGRFDDVLRLWDTHPLQLDSSLIFNFLYKFKGLSHIECDTGA